MYRVAHAGQMGYHQRTEYNKWIMSSGTKPEEVNPEGGFKHYGNVKNTYVLVKGSIPGPKKRLITMLHGIRPKKRAQMAAPELK